MNHLVNQARNMERSFVAKCKKMIMVFLTGNGKANMVQAVNKDCLTIKIVSSDKSFTLTRKKLRMAIEYFLTKRTVVRKDLEPFSVFSSSLLGLLQSVFTQMVKIQKTVKGLLRLTLKGLRFWFSGIDRCVADLEEIKRQGGSWVLGTYFHLRKDKNERWKHHLSRLGMKMFVDSGALSVWKAQKSGKPAKEIDLMEYGSFVERHMVDGVIYAYLNLDVFGSPEQSKANFDLLTSIVGVPPVPIYHVTQPIDELERLIREDHELIALGASAFIGRKRRTELISSIVEAYPDQNFHLLGCGSGLLFQVDLFSADAQTWAAGRKYNQIATPEGTRQMSGWSGIDCLRYNIQQYLSLEKTNVQGDFEQYEPNISPLLPVSSW